MKYKILKQPKLEYGHDWFAQPIHIGTIITTIEYLYNCIICYPGVTARELRDETERAS